MPTKTKTAHKAAPAHKAGGHKTVAHKTVAHKAATTQKAPVPSKPPSRTPSSPPKSLKDQDKHKDKAKTGEAGEKETPDTPDPPLPLLDLSDAAVKKLIKAAKKRGYVTYQNLNAVLPSEEVTSEQIEDILAMLSEMGINVVEQEDAEPGEEGEKEEADDEEEPGNALVEVQAKVPAKAETKEPSE